MSDGTHPASSKDADIAYLDELNGDMLSKESTGDDQTRNRSMNIPTDDDIEYLNHINGEFQLKVPTANDQTPTGSRPGAVFVHGQAEGGASTSGGANIESTSDGGNGQDVVADPNLEQQYSPEEALLTTDGTPIADLDLPIAEEVAANEDEVAMKSLLFSNLYGVAIFLLAAGVLLAIFFGSRSSFDSDSGTPINHTTAPTTSPSEVNLTEQVEAWMPAATKEAIDKDAESPQSLAYEWLLNDTNLADYPDWRAKQRFALATFYYATGGPNWYNNDGWLSYTLHECYWYSFTDIPALSGELPHLDAMMDEYARLTRDPYHLQNPCHEDPNSLDKIPKIGKLQVLSQVRNGLQGKLPPEIYLPESLKGIVVIDDVEAELTSEIQNVADLAFLGIPASTGTIPSEIGLLTNLIMLSFVSLTKEMSFSGLFEHSELTGSIPTTLGNLEKLMHFSMENNEVNGAIPSEVGRLSNILEFIIHKSGTYDYWYMTCSVFYRRQCSKTYLFCVCSCRNHWAYSL